MNPEIPHSAAFDERMVEDDRERLPDYIVLREDGVFVDRTRIRSASAFATFADGVFLNGQRFEGLVYSLFLSLVFDWKPQPDGEPELLARAIVSFESARREIYKGVKISPQKDFAEYFFEQPVLMEVEERLALLGPVDAHGAAAIIGHETRTQTVATQYVLDEFIADMWVKGVRYGIDLEVVHDCIDNKRAERIAFAHGLPPVPASDAALQEVFEGLHRDNSPKMLANGRHDLRQYSNRFPQIEAGIDIFRKIPKTRGVGGLTVTGEYVEPPGAPKDFVMDALSGPGTRVEHRGDAEYIVSVREGFLNLDPKTNLVSVSEKVINKDEVSLRTTGDLNLSGDHFENHGDVQDRRLVEGKHMTFHGDIFGQIESHAGEVQVHGNVMNGSINSPGGSIHLDGRASNARIEARSGRVELRLAEGSRIVGQHVRIERAVRCEIIADHLDADLLESCTVATLDMKVAQAGSYKGGENRFYLIKPDTGLLAQEQQELQVDLSRLQADMAARQIEVDTLRSQPELAKYLALAQRVKTGALKLNDVQMQQLQAAGQKFTTPLKAIRAKSAEIEQLQISINRVLAMSSRAEERQESLAGSLHGSVREITGDTTVRFLALEYFFPPLGEAQVDVVRNRLQHPDADGAPLFAGDSGFFDWHGTDA